jgi:hypothetical protein
MSAATPTANLRLTAVALTCYKLGLRRVAVWLQLRAVPKPYRPSPEVGSRVFEAILVHGLSPDDAASWAMSRSEAGAL